RRVVVAEVRGAVARAPAGPPPGTVVVMVGPRAAGVGTAEAQRGGEANAAAEGLPRQGLPGGTLRGGEPGEDLFGRGLADLLRPPVRLGGAVVLARGVREGALRPVQDGPDAGLLLRGEVQGVGD